jgi:hypothetical protein
MFISSRNLRSSLLIALSVISVTAHVASAAEREIQNPQIVENKELSGKQPTTARERRQATRNLHRSSSVNIVGTWKGVLSLNQNYCGLNVDSNMSDGLRVISTRLAYDPFNQPYLGTLVNAGHVAYRAPRRSPDPRCRVTESYNLSEPFFVKNGKLYGLLQHYVQVYCPYNDTGCVTGFSGYAVKR